MQDCTIYGYGCFFRGVHSNAEDFLMRCIVKISRQSCWLAGILTSMLMSACALDQTSALIPVDSTVDTESNTDAIIDPSLFEISASISPAISTVGIVTWSFKGTAPLSSAEIAFGRTTDYEYTAPVDLTEPNFRTLLLGMKPDTLYHYEIRIISGGLTYKSGDHTILTGPVINWPGATPAIDTAVSGAAEKGFIVTSSYAAQRGRGPIAFILDPDGDLVWWFQTSLDKVSAAKMTFDGKHMVIVPVNLMGTQGTITVVSMDGLNSKTLDFPGATHDFTPMPNGNIAFISINGMAQGQPPTCGQILEVDLDGNDRVLFDMANAWKPPCHPNAIRYSLKENIFTLSDRSHSEIIGISPEGTLLWRVNQGGTLWRNQHGHQLLDDSLLLYANGDNTAREYEFSKGALGDEIWRYTSSAGTAVLGNVQRLPGGNTLITYSMSQVIHEVAPDQTLVRSIAFDQIPIGYAGWRASLYGPPDDMVF
jgi:hypothetical protein